MQVEWSRCRTHGQHCFPRFFLLIAIAMMLPSAAMAADDDYATIDLTTAHRAYHITNQNAFTIETGDTVVLSTELRYTHNGLGNPASFNENTFGLMVTDAQAWWGKAGGVKRNDLAVASRGAAIGSRLPASPFIEGWINHSALGVDPQANLLDPDNQPGVPKPIADHVPQVSDWIEIEWTLSLNSAGNVEAVGSLTSLADSTISYSTTPYELGTVNVPSGGTSGYQTGATLYGGFTTAWDKGVDDDNDSSTPNVGVAKSQLTNFTRSDVDNFTVTKNGTVVITDDFSSYAVGEPIPGALNTDPSAPQNNWNPKYSTIDPDGVPDSGDEDFSQQLLFVASGTPVEGLACNFNTDSQCDIADLDLLYANFGGDAAYDVDGSTVVDSNDIGAWLAAASAPANPYLGGTKTFALGDLTLDGNVDSTDLGQLLNNFGDTTGMLFGAGNLNGDATVDSSDLGLLLNTFGTTSAAAAAVPEPGTLSMLLIAAMGLVGIGRRRR